MIKTKHQNICQHQTRKQIFISPRVIIHWKIVPLWMHFSRPFRNIFGKFDMHDCSGSLHESNAKEIMFVACLWPPLHAFTHPQVFRLEFVRNLHFKRAQHRIADDTDDAYANRIERWKDDVCTRSKRSFRPLHSTWFAHNVQANVHGLKVSFLDGKCNVPLR
jgi:hypothetical protein